MRSKVWLGLALVIAAPSLLAILYVLGLIPNLTSTIEEIIIAIVSAMVISGCTLIWNGSKPDEQANQRKRDIWEAIRDWVESPPQTDYPALPLADAPPKLATEIDACLKNYPSLWKNLQDLRQKSTKPIGSSTQNGVALEKAFSGLLGMHMRLVQQFKSEILDKHYTHLKC